MSIHTWGIHTASVVTLLYVRV